MRTHRVAFSDDRGPCRALPIQLGPEARGLIILPLVLARLSGIIVLAAYALGQRAPLVPATGARGIAFAAGALDSAANIVYVLAVQRATLALVAAIVSLAPATSVLLARIFLGERWSRIQRVGFVTALAAGAMVSLG